ncbi:nitrous oxide reductase accessory protein NosL [Natrarchaeobius sp. A-rgal3]|uniref:nitrous oxide reductase accessory protein NosL n=1 Tax=Natrarchaeobius versutus TaxID=1679078 RepID=UPI00350EE93B
MSERGVSGRMGGEYHRRAVLASVGVAGLGAFAGCLEGDSAPEAPDPITIDSSAICDNCTMPIVDHPGPVGQSFYDDPEAVLGGGDDRPAQFCSSLCTYAFTFEHDDHEPTVTYLTDYSTVDYEIDTGGDEPEISSHVEADAFGEVTTLTLIVDSEVQGAMGASMIGFSEADDAEAFEAEHGGGAYEHGDVDRELVMSLM